MPSRSVTSSVISMPWTRMPVSVLNGSVSGLTRFGFWLGQRLHLLVVVGQAPVGAGAPAGQRRRPRRGWSCAARRGGPLGLCAYQVGDLDGVRELGLPQALGVLGRRAGPPRRSCLPPCSVRSRPILVSSSLRSRLGSRTRTSDSLTGCLAGLERRWSSRRCGRSGRSPERRQAWTIRLWPAGDEALGALVGAEVGRAGHAAGGSARRTRPRPSRRARPSGWRSRSPMPPALGALAHHAGARGQRALDAVLGLRPCRPWPSRPAAFRPVPARCQRPVRPPRRRCRRSNDDSYPASQECVPVPAGFLQHRGPLRATRRAQLTPTDGPAARAPGCPDGPPRRRTASGVVTTPARMPARKSRSTRSAAAGVPPVGLEPVQVDAQVAAPVPQVRILQPALVGHQRVVELPEPPLARGGLGGQRQDAGARVLGDHREVAEHAPDRQVADQEVRLGAVRALQVRVLDQQRAVARARGRRARRPGPARSRGRSGRLERVEDEVGARDLERRGRLVGPGRPFRSGPTMTSARWLWPRSSM